MFQVLQDLLQYFLIGLIDTEGIDTMRLKHEDYYKNFVLNLEFMNLEIFNLAF